MKIAVISDLHIGYDKDTHQLGHSDHDFAAFLFYLENNFDRIILLGDIYEISMAYGEDADIFKLANINHATITKRFKKDKYLYVFGNHDLVGEKFGGIEKFRITYENKRYCFIHGHQFDEAHNQLHVNIFGGLFLKLGMISIYKWFTEQIESAYYSTSKENERFERVAIQYAKDKYDVIICGHSHMPKIYEKESVTYINSGTCTYGRYCYIDMDLAKKEYAVKSYEKN